MAITKRTAMRAISTLPGERATKPLDASANGLRLGVCGDVEEEGKS
jgi:hypothetical protein